MLHCNTVGKRIPGWEGGWGAQAPNGVEKISTTVLAVHQGLYIHESLMFSNNEGD